MSAAASSTPWPPRCSQCHGPVRLPPAWPPGCQLAWWCDRCAARPVHQAGDVQRLHRFVQGFLQQHLGLAMAPWLTAAQVRLVPPQHWPGQGNRRQLGEARTRVRVHSGPAGVRRELVEAEVLLLPGLPFLDAARVLAHEAFHVYSAGRGLDMRSQLEEGTANLWAYLLLAVHPGSGLVEDLRLHMLRDPDATYGEGFRLARSHYKLARGFADFLRRLQTSGLAAA